MYTARVEDKFNKFRELLVVADKYQVLELVNYCGTKLAKTLNNDMHFKWKVLQKLTMRRTL